MRSEIKLPESSEQQQLLFGQADQHLRLIRAEFNIKVIPRGDILILEGQDGKVRQAVRIVEALLYDIASGENSIDRRLALLMETAGEDHSGPVRTERGELQPKTQGQKDYLRKVRSHGLVFATGPAGTGKTFLAAALAVEALRRGEVERLVLTRPAVEAGENLGFLPGDMREKVDPYLRPVYDALGDMLQRRQFVHYIETGVIEVAPLAFMRGRTLNRAFVILDEAQNTTPVQMKMFLTRLGERSRCIVTGDLTQVDLDEGRECGLRHAIRILSRVTGAAVVRLSKEDIVRHPLVAAIVQAYEEEKL